MIRTVSIWLAMLALCAGTAVADDDVARAKQILKEVIAIQNIAGSDKHLEIAELIKERLLTQTHLGEDNIHVIGHGDNLYSLVARYRGKSADKKPIMLMAHLDVVPANRSDWEMDPFTLTESNGYFFGRGVEDNKTGAVMLVNTLITLSQDEFVPDRDLVLVLTSDEETNAYAIMDLLNNHRALVDAEYALNSDSGGGTLRGGSAESYSIQASEKIYQTFHLTVKNPGGHSSVPRSDNAIYTLTRALNKISQHRFPVELNPITEGFFRASATSAPPQLAAAMRKVAIDPKNEASVAILERANPYYRAQLRTTCVATKLEAGHADNALPQTAQATVNCRILPTSSTESVEKLLTQLINNEEVVLTRVNEPTPSDPSPLREDVMTALNSTLISNWGLVTIVPTMSNGATDGLYVRNAGIPVYGVSGIFSEIGDSGAHGQNERIKVSSFISAVSHWEMLIRELTGGQ